MLQTTSHFLKTVQLDWFVFSLLKLYLCFTRVALLEYIDLFFKISSHPVEKGAWILEVRIREVWQQ